MPTYLLHGFRWSRPSIRIHIILQNLDDAASEWIVAPNTQRTLRHNFHKLYPEPMQHLPNLRFIEQYDPEDLTSESEQPYAYVADVVQEIRLGIDVDDVRSHSIPTAQWSAFVDLRDRLAADEKIGWYIVVCGDEERWAPPSDGSVESLSPENSGGSESEGTDHSDTSTETQTSRRSDPVEPKGLKKLWNSNRLSGRKSRPNEASDSVPSDSVPRQDTTISHDPRVTELRAPYHVSQLQRAQTTGNISPGISVVPPFDVSDGPVELSACPPTREGLPIAVSNLSDSSASTQAKSRARSLRRRKPSVSPMRSSVVPSLSSFGVSRHVSPNDVASRRPLQEVEERRARPLTREIMGTPEVFSGIADAQKQKRRSRRFSLQSFHKGHNDSSAPTETPPPVPERSIAGLLSDLGNLSVTRRRSFHPMQHNSTPGGVSPLSLANPNASTNDFILPSPLSAHPPDPEDDDEFDDYTTTKHSSRLYPTLTKRQSRLGRDAITVSARSIPSQHNSSNAAYLSARPEATGGEHITSVMDATAAAINAFPAPPPTDLYAPKELEATNSNLPSYFGQTVSQFDLIANGIENAFVALR